MARVSPPWIAPHPNPAYTRVIEDQAMGRYTDQQFLPRTRLNRTHRLKDAFESDGTWKSNVWDTPLVAPRPKFSMRPVEMPAYFRDKPTPMFSDHSKLLQKPVPVDNPDPSKYYDPNVPVSDKTNHGRGSVIIAQFFNNGESAFVSENGISNANLYYRTTRPYGARLRSHPVSKTTPAGYLFDCYKL
eukprot:CAMPEP_0175101750 /NCGR_PEP_ID=MMETSP0086_2-20121207/8003_1 /TAXON_ID=136419 /ORGANISM="Unknown Unknown, Strain D1" /LENGTH=186 /DNA_ID=CAMNT_0016376381 /DNA_START=26 /DNA_END=586 /DNA_ORIENTATION=-